MEKPRFQLWVVCLVLLLPAEVGRGDAWLADDANAIWNRSPGFYREGSDWYAIVHVKPGVTRVRLAGTFTDWADHAVDLTRTPDGKFWWFKGADDSFHRPPAAGDGYKFILNHGEGSPDVWRQDPAARRVENSGLGSNSLVTISDAYEWQDDDWSRPEWHRHMIYQVHPLRFTDRNLDADGQSLSPFLQLTEELDNDGTNDYLNHTGTTAVQLLPVNEFFGDVGWGYNPSFFYAVESAYGAPDDLKRLVDTAHRNGIAVILDVVYNHGGSDDNILWQMAQESLHDGTYYDGDTRWGAMINFDNDIARHFFVQNIAYLAREFHIDGFRFDFTRPIHNESDGNITVRGSGGGWRFLREVRAAAKAVDPGIILIAEELPNTWYVTREAVDSQFAGDSHGPFDAQWADPFHDHFKEVLKGQHLNNLYEVFTHFGDSWQDALIYTESHDEVGNTDDRIARRARDGKGWEMLQVAAAGTICGRGIPMIFMGQEAGETMQFGQDDRKLGEYNPGTGHTWWDDRLDLNAYESDAGRRKVRGWHRRLFEIRGEDPEAFAWPDIAIAHIHDENGVAAFVRGDGKYLIVLNFKGNSWDQYEVGVSGRYRELANTSWPAFNLGGYAERTRGGDAAHQLDNVPVPAYGAVVLRREN
jgi:1,4-alpha-glucan branching enzyme